jgi:hypothetical protein
MRFPEFCTTIPVETEVHRVFKEMGCLVINYTSISDVSELNKAFLYNCEDQEYEIDKLTSSSVRRNIRYARRNLQFGFVEWSVILEKGFRAFADTRNKVGLSDGNRKTFNERFQKFSKNSAHKAAAAWLEDDLVGFLSLIVVEDYVIIQGTFSTDEHKSIKPNNLLIDFVLTHYLREKKYALVCYGLSSIQESANQSGLHDYKIHVGFNAIPVKRNFIMHPKLKPMKPLLQIILKTLLLIFNKNRFLRKAYGLIRLTDSD